MRRNRNAKIVATLGPASGDPDTIRALFKAGADVFRLNFSHGSHEEHRRRHEILRQIESGFGRPIGIMVDLQGPKLRIGTFAEGCVSLEAGQEFRLEREAVQGDRRRVCLPHAEIFAALKPGMELLLNDGRLKLEVVRCGRDFADTIVRAGGLLSDRKGVNVAGAVLPISALTPKDLRDLDFGLALGADWVALSFVQRPEDVVDARRRIGDRAAIIVKLEKPAAMEHLEEIVAVTDAVMVARGDLGVEMPPEQVPCLQKRILQACRKAGKPVIVATQMLESMVAEPVPTRAEASDVATAIYDGADAVMLSAESASGRYPVEAVRMMDRIIVQVERDPLYRQVMEASHTPGTATAADAISCALRRVAGLLPVAATLTYTSSGFSTLRAARERPEAPIVSMTPRQATARRLTLAWGVHSVHTPDVDDVPEMVSRACETAVREGFARSGDTLVVTAGMPFGTSGTTNLLRIAQVP